MKNKPVGLTIAVCVFVLLSMACGTDSQNTNANLANVDPEDIKSDAAACSVVDPEDRAEAVRLRIEKKIGDDDEIEKMFKGSGGKPKRFKFQVVAVPNNYLVIYIEGLVNRENEFDDFVRLLDDFVKQKCAHKVVFVPDGTLPITDSSRSVPGFEWHYCEYPKVACPNGLCEESCTGDIYSSSAPANAKGTENSNTNTNSNANTKSVNSNN